MNSATDALDSPLSATLSRLPRSAETVLSLLSAIAGGRITLTLPNGQDVHSGHGAAVAAMSVNEWSVFDDVLGAGDIGFAESYMDGRWDTPDLAALLTLLARNREPVARALYGNWWGVLRHKILHGLRANTRRGSRRNIAAHYDLGNDFYRLWLDPSMSYSSALFSDEPDMDLEVAQQAKYRRILESLAVRPGDHILEIGCGWGGFAEMAARTYGARVTGITLSEQQLAYARERIAREGLAERVTLELRDYRDLAGRFDHIVSIEMFEAVGERFWPSYFAKLRELLKPGGKAVIQTITIADGLFARYRKGTDFIQRYIFPGGMLPSASVFAAKASAAGLAVTGDFAFGADYARTLAQWRERFDAREQDLEALGYGSVFRRMWRFYLAYCEAGFAAASTDVHHFELSAGAP
jgi:cyclopropane-fatty-acyl-phospholipid synthase